ncbi:MAG: ATP-binding cassette domain-containing protein [Rhodospirillales bacterium]|jgi:ABC transport system ATP-binding/permease protein|nr:ATP-binding cassette domain-containing protein [Rhodospirillales bacterium]
MPPPILTLQDIDLTFGGTPMLDGAELSVSQGERLCLVGRNGSGKSTILKIAAGLIEADGGERFVQPGATIRYLSQEPDLSGCETVLSYVLAGLAPGDDPYRAQYLLEQLGLTGRESPASVSGGEARRAALARALAPEPDILLLDEPTNHLDLPAIEWLESEIKNSRSALVLISHDRRFLENLSRVTVWLDRGETRRLEKGFAHFEAWRDEFLELEELDRHKLDRKLAAEADWLRYGVTARRKRNQGRLRALKALRRERREQRKVTGNVKMTVAEGVTSGKLVAEAKGVSKSYGERAIVRDFSIRIKRGDRVGIVGPNGAGKTTLLNLLTGVLPSDEGSLRLGANLQFTSLDQKRDSLDPKWTLSDALTGNGGDTVSVGGNYKHVVSYMKDFLFAPEQARTPIGRLSGGERGRLMLARAFSRPSNLLVLDEPTNDLDLETLDLLQEMLADYAGTVLLVSHDRDFLDRVVTSVIADDGQARWIEYAGGYSFLDSQRKGRSVEQTVAKQPRRKSVGKENKIPKSKPKAKRKLSFNEQYALKTLPDTMEKLQTDIAALQKKIADPDLYARDPAAFEAAADDLKSAQAQLDEAEEQWLALELLKEELNA